MKAKNLNFLFKIPRDTTGLLLITGNSDNCLHSSNIKFFFSFYISICTSFLGVDLECPEQFSTPYIYKKCKA